MMITAFTQMNRKLASAGPAAGSPRETISAARSMTDELKAKGRRRRETLKSLAQVSITAASARNDVVPKRELVERAPGRLVVPARNVRKLEPAHVREVATGISTSGFGDP